MVVAEIMTKNPATASARTPIRDVIEKLLELDVRHLPIVQAGQLVGIVSDRDLRPLWALEALVSEKVAERLSRPVSTLMTQDVISVHPETELREVVEIMLDQKVGALPVLEPDSQRLVGIVSYVDVLRAVTDAL